MSHPAGSSLDKTMPSQGIALQRQKGLASIHRNIGMPSCYFIHIKGWILHDFFFCCCCCLLLCSFASWLFLLWSINCFPFFLKRQTCCLFFFKYSPGREERCWEGLQCEICSGRARAEAAYEWVSVFRRCSMLLRTFYMNGVCLSAFRYQGDKDAASLLFFRRPVGFFFLLSFLLFHWLILKTISFTILL